MKRLPRPPADERDIDLDVAAPTETLAAPRGLHVDLLREPEGGGGFEPDFDAYYTYADYVRMRLYGYYELIRGYLRKMSSPTDGHQAVAGELFIRLSDYLRASGSSCILRIAPYDVRLHPGPDHEQDTVVVPDLCVICDRSKIERRGCNGAPDLLVEVRSPSTGTYDRTTKSALYEAAGVPEFWIADPILRRVEQRLLGVGGRYAFPPQLFAEGQTVESEVLPGFAVDVRELFGVLITD